MPDKEPEIRKIYKPTDEQHEDLRQVYERYQQMGDKRKEMETKWDKWQKQWEGYRKPRDTDDWTSDIYIPLTASIVEAMMSEIVNQELMPYAVPRGVEDQPKATVINSILEYTWDVAKSGPALHEIIHDALVMGTGVGQEYYLKQEREIRTAKGDKHKVLEYDDCFLEPVSLWDLYVDEKARSFFGPFGARDAIRRYIMDIADFKIFFKGKNWDPFNAARFVKPGGNVDYYEFYHPPERLDHSKEVEVLWYWNKPEDKSQPRPRHIHVKVKLDGRTLLTTQFYFEEDVAVLGNEGLFAQAGSLGNLLILQAADSVDMAGGAVNLLANNLVIDTGSPGSLTATPSQGEGPYYPVVSVADYDNDLALVP